MNESTMWAIFRDIKDVDWPLISQKLSLTLMWINDKCLRQTLKRWYDNNKKKDPWTTWRKLAVVVTSVYDSKAGQELRQQAGVGA